MKRRKRRKVYLKEEEEEEEEEGLEEEGIESTISLWSLKEYQYTRISLSKPLQT